jgi:hypothetical protein
MSAVLKAVPEGVPSRFLASVRDIGASVFSAVLEVEIFDLLPSLRDSLMTERWSASFVQTAVYASKSISLSIDSFTVISCSFHVILWYNSSLYIVSGIFASPARCKKDVRKSRLALAPLLGS